MRRHFFLQIEPFSINAKFSRDLRYKSARYKDWEARMFMKLSLGPVQRALQDLREYFDPKLHAYCAKFTFYYPKFYTKEGTISAQTEDLSNTEKILVDCIFLSKNHVLPVPYGAPNLNTDDKHIVSLVSRKKPAPEGTATYMRVDLAIIKSL